MLQPGGCVVYALPHMPAGCPAAPWSASPSHGDASAAAWDKARSRLNKGLRAMMGTGKSAAIVQDELGRWVLSPELTILGLVEDAALDPSVRRRGSRFESDAPIGFRPRE